MTMEQIVERLHARHSGSGWMAACPAHDDRKPSLSINEREGESFSTAMRAAPSKLFASPLESSPVISFRNKLGSRTSLEPTTTLTNPGTYCFRLCDSIPKLSSSAVPLVTVSGLGT